MSEDLNCMPRRRYLREQAQANGQEYPDPTPVEASLVPAPLTLREEMRRFIKQELSQQADNNGMETFEESDDFSIEDEEPDFTTGYTVHDLDNPEVKYDDLEGDPAADTTEPPTPPAEPAEPAETSEDSVDKT